MNRSLCLLTCLIFALAVFGGRVLADQSGAPAGQTEAAAKDSEPKAEKAKRAAGRSRAKTQKPKAETAASEAEKPKDAAAEAKPTEAKPADKADAKPTLAEKSAGAKPEAPATYTVKRDVIKVEVSLEGVFEAKRMHELSLRPESWMNFEVLKAVQHGQHVKKGELLLEFDPKKLNEAIADQRTSLRLDELSFKQAEASLRLQEESTPADLAASERSKRIAGEDYARFLQVDRQMSEKVAKFNLQSAQESLDYEKEELAQLEKMYKADDLTEETEEIVLKRQRDRVRQAEFYLELSKLRCEQDLKIDLPRVEEMLQEFSRTAGLANDRAKSTLPSSLQRARIDLEKLKVQQDRDVEKLKKLETDRAAMTVNSPADGVAYYGQCDRGKWGSVSSVADDLRPGGIVSANEVFMTVVAQRPMILRVTVPEKSFHWVRSGLEGTIEPAGFPDLRLKATIDQVEAVPYSSATFGATLTVSLGKGTEALVPGMTCTVKLVPYLKEDALVVPASAIETDKIDEQKRYVYVMGKSGKPAKRPVILGQKMGDRTEVIKGLREGDKILKEVPKDKDA